MIIFVVFSVDACSDEGHRKGVEETAGVPAETGAESAEGECRELWLAFGTFLGVLWTAVHGAREISTYYYYYYYI